MFRAYHLDVPTVMKSGSLNLLETSGPVQVSTGIPLPLLLYLYRETYVKKYYDYVSLNDAVYYYDLFAKRKHD